MEIFKITYGWRDITPIDPSNSPGSRTWGTPSPASTIFASSSPTSPHETFSLPTTSPLSFPDFTESTILPLDTDIETVDDNGYSIYTDIGQLGAVMYEIITGRHCDFDLFKDQRSGPAQAIWPKREDLPSTHGLWLGSIIEACWTKTFKSAHELSVILDSITLE